MNRRSAILSTMLGWFVALWGRLGFANKASYLANSLIETREVTDKWNRRITKSFVGTIVLKSEVFQVLERMKNDGWVLDKLECREKKELKEIDPESIGQKAPLRCYEQVIHNYYQTVQIAFWKPLRD